jgi:hypothetical protein
MMTTKNGFIKLDFLYPYSEIHLITMNKDLKF